MSRNAFASSWSRAFVRSHAKARGVFAAGVKTVHSCLPYTGYGNVLVKGGGITTDPKIPWLFTKKTVTTSWSHTFTYGGHSNTIPQQQTARLGILLGFGWTLNGSGSCADGGSVSFDSPPPGYTGDTAYCMNDLSDPVYSTFPAAPANVTAGSAGTVTSKYNSFFNVTGATLSVPEVQTGTPPSSIGSSAGVIIPFDAQAGVDDLHTSNTQPYIPEYGLPNTVYTYDKTTDISSIEIHQSLVNGLCAFGASAGDNIMSYIPGSPHLAPYQLFLYGTEIYSYRTETIYSDPVSIAGLETKARAMLDATTLTNSGERYWTFDGSMTVRLDWNPVVNTIRIDVYRADVVAGVIGSYTRIALLFPGASLIHTFTDTTVVVGQTYSYFVQSLAGPGNSNTAAISIAVVAPVGSPVTTEPAPFVSTGSTPTGAPTGFAVTLMPFALTYTRIALALGDATSPNRQIILFATSNGLPVPSFVISANVTCGTPMPFYLAGRAVKYNEAPLIIGVTGASGLVWSKSRGYLPGNSPHHAPPTTNFAQKFYYKPGAQIGGGALVDISSLFPKLTFPHGRGGNYLWQMTKELPSTDYPHPESIYVTDVPAIGYITYPNLTALPAVNVGAGSTSQGAGAGANNVDGGL
ncbi:MAG TPA: hypothetical protein VNN22_24135 [Verrucomicrobiae bacterium]|nr:hypothetical protein [Verrucomicrobiae bacterium]